jgi:putative FmdB family regulatory protein
MPIYEYECTACGHHLDVLQKVNDEALTDCPSCHKVALQKLVSATSFQLKGTGWYATDFRNKNPSEPKKESANSDSSSSSEGSKSSSGSNDDAASA